MKAVIALFLTLFFILQLTAAELESNSLHDVKTAELHVARSVRDAEKSKKPGKKEKPKKNKKNAKRKGKKKRQTRRKQKNGNTRSNRPKNKNSPRKRPGKGGNNKGRNKKRNKASGKRKGRRNRGKSTKTGQRKQGKEGRNNKQTCSLTCVTDKLKKYVLYTNQLRKNKRISGFVSQIQKKKDKAKTTFNDSASAIETQTYNGTSCNSSTPDSETTSAASILPKCFETAQKICDVTLDTAEASQVADCKTPLENYIAAFESCFRAASPVCSCFDALTPVAANCEDHDPALTRVKAIKDDCNSASKSGSFASCRQQQVALGPIINKCNPYPPHNHNTVTTVAPGKFRHRNIIQKFKTFNKL